MLMARLSPRAPPGGVVAPTGAPRDVPSVPRASTLAAMGSACKAAAGRLLWPGALWAVTGAAASTGSACAAELVGRGDTCAGLQASLLWTAWSVMPAWGRVALSDNSTGLQSG